MASMLETEADMKLAQLKDEELDVRIAELRERRFRLLNQSVSEKVDDNSQFGKIRRDIARLITEREARARKA